MSDPRWCGELVLDQAGRLYYENIRMRGRCRLNMYGGPFPRRFCNNEIFKNGRCKQHNRQYTKRFRILA